MINYLRACPLPKAKERMDELAKLDPETVKRASTLFFPLGAGTPPTAATTDKPAEGTTTPAAAAEAKSAADAKPAANAKTPATAPAVSSKPAEAAPTEKKPAAEAGAVLTPAVSPSVDSSKTEPATAGAATTVRLSKDANAPPQEEDRSVGVFVGLAAAAAVLSCAFWIILKGGQHAAG